jgi:hypothetical protein
MITWMRVILLLMLVYCDIHEVVTVHHSIFNLEVIELYEQLPCILHMYVQSNIGMKCTQETIYTHQP